MELYNLLAYEEYKIGETKMRSNDNIARWFVCRGYYVCRIFAFITDKNIRVNRKAK